MQAARDRQKSYADLKRKPMEFQVGDKVMLKVSPWKGVVRFGKRGKLNPRYVGPFKVIERVGEVAYKLELPEELTKSDPIVKFDGISMRGLSFTWEREDNSKRKIPTPLQQDRTVVKCRIVAFDLLRDALSAIFGLSELKTVSAMYIYFCHSEARFLELSRLRILTRRLPTVVGCSASEDEAPILIIHHPLSAIRHSRVSLS
ncbi:hypothetical protein Tco_0057845 [Tanacetum coccineum]